LVFDQLLNSLEERNERGNEEAAGEVLSYA
jgi:hypothetical protein